MTATTAAVDSLNASVKGYPKPTSIPVQKVAWSAAAGALVTAILLVLGASGVAIPNGLEAALTTIVTFVVGWIVPPGANEGVVSSSLGSRSGRVQG